MAYNTDQKSFDEIIGGVISSKATIIKNRVIEKVTGTKDSAESANPYTKLSKIANSLNRNTIRYNKMITGKPEDIVNSASEQIIDSIDTVNKNFIRAIEKVDSELSTISSGMKVLDSRVTKLESNTKDLSKRFSALEASKEPDKHQAWKESIHGSFSVLGNKEKEHGHIGSGGHGGILTGGRISLSRLGTMGASVAERSALGIGTMVTSRTGMAAGAAAVTGLGAYGLYKYFQSPGTPDLLGDLKSPPKFLEGLVPPSKIGTSSSPDNPIWSWLKRHNPFDTENGPASGDPGGAIPRPGSPRAESWDPGGAIPRPQSYNTGISRVSRTTQEMLSDLQSGNTNNSLESLSGSRQTMAKELDKNPELKERMLALALAEVGDKQKLGTENDRAQRALMETIFNRKDAQRITSLDKTMSASYYQPFQDGSYTRSLAKIRSDPKLKERLEQRFNEVLAGSNDSNFATHNSSAGVAASANRTQTITANLSGETFSRKDRQEYSGIHGHGTTKRERSWHERMLGSDNKSPYINLERPPTAEELRKESAIQGKNATAMFDPTQPGASQALETAKSLGITPIAYWQGGGDKSFGEKELDLTSDKGRASIKSTAEQHMKAGYGGIKIDNLHRLKTTDDMKGVFDSVPAGMKIVPNGNSALLNQFLEKHPEYKDRIIYGESENLASGNRKEELEGTKGLTKKGVPMVVHEWTKAIDKSDSATREQAAALANSMPGVSVNLYNQKEMPGKGETGGISGRDNVQTFTSGYQPSEPAAAKAQLGVGRFTGRDALSGIQLEDTNVSAGTTKKDVNRVIQKQASVAGIRKGVLKDSLVSQLQYAGEASGVFVEVTSGGQRMHGARGHTGSHRHDHGGAADVNLYVIENNKKRILDPRNPNDIPLISKFTEEAAKAGVSGVGAAYMSDPTKIHYGGGNEPGGAGKDIAYAGPSWFKDSFWRGVKSRGDFNTQQLKDSPTKTENTQYQNWLQSVYPSADTKTTEGPIKSEVPGTEIAQTARVEQSQQQVEQTEPEVSVPDFGGSRMREAIEASVPDFGGSRMREAIGSPDVVPEEKAPVVGGMSQEAAKGLFGKQAVEDAEKSAENMVTPQETPYQGKTATPEQKVAPPPEPSPKEESGQKTEESTQVKSRPKKEKDDNEPIVTGNRSGVDKRKPTVSNGGSGDSNRGYKNFCNV